MNRVTVDFGADINNELSLGNGTSLGSGVNRVTVDFGADINNELSRRKRDISVR